MDISKIQDHIAELRRRRDNLQEIRDYRVQKKAAKAEPEPKMDAKPAEEIFAGLFTTVEDSNDVDGTNRSTPDASN